MIVASLGIVGRQRNVPESESEKIVCQSWHCRKQRNEPKVVGNDLVPILALSQTAKRSESDREWSCASLGIVADSETIRKWSGMILCHDRE